MDAKSLLEMEFDDSEVVNPGGTDWYIDHLGLFGIGLDIVDQLDRLSSQKTARVQPRGHRSLGCPPGRPLDYKSFVKVNWEGRGDFVRLCFRLESRWG